LVLTPYGGIGAALVSLVAYCLAFGILLVGARRRFNFPLRLFLVPRRADAAFLAVAVVKTLRRLGEQRRRLASRHSG
jgi:hypothetical protein